MFFAEAKLTGFFTNGLQMALSTYTHDCMAQEGCVIVEDFEELKIYQMEKATKNLCMETPDITAQLDTNEGVLVP